MYSVTPSVCTAEPGNSVVFKSHRPNSPVPSGFCFSFCFSPTSLSAVCLKVFQNVHSSMRYAETCIPRTPSARSGSDMMQHLRQTQSWPLGATSFCFAETKLDRETILCWFVSFLPFSVFILTSHFLCNIISTQSMPRMQLPEALVQ